jgi:hypothetical protein
MDGDLKSGTRVQHRASEDRSLKPGIGAEHLFDHEPKVRHHIFGHRLSEPCHVGWYVLRRRPRQPGSTGCTSGSALVLMALVAGHVRAGPRESPIRIPRRSRLEMARISDACETADEPPELANWWSVGMLPGM